MKKLLASLGIGGTLVLGGVTLLPDSRDVTLRATATEKGQFDFGPVPEYTLDVSETGVMNITTQDKAFSLEPSDIKVDKKTEHSKSFFLEVSNKEKGALIDKAWGDGSKILLDAQEKKLSKIVQIDETFLKELKGDYLEISFTLGGDFIVPNGVYTERVEIAPNVWLEKGTAWDSNMEGDPNQNYTDIQLEVKNGVLIKRIPISWLKTAVFPIYTDAIFTFGTKQLFQLNPNLTVDTLKIGTDKFVNCWVDNTDATQEGYCIVGSVSGTTITYGASSTAYEADIAGTANNQTAGACAAGDDRWVVVYTDDGATDDIYARVASSTGTTVNGYGTAFLVYDGTNPNSGYATCTYISTDRIALAYSEQDGIDSKVKICNISATYTLTCGIEYTMSNGTSGIAFDNSCATLNTDKFVCQFGTNVSYSVVVGTVSGTSTVTLGTAVPLAPAGCCENLGHTIMSPTTDSFGVIWHAGGTGVSPIYFALGTVSGTTITLGATTTPIMATTTSFDTVVAIDSDSAFWMGQWGTVDQPSTFLAAVPIEMNFSTLTFSTSSPETVDATTDPGSLHAAQISSCKFVFTWEDDNDTNDLFAIIGDIAGCGASIVDDIIWFD